MGGPAAVHELRDLVISKLAVGPYDNNAYLLRCTATRVVVVRSNIDAFQTGTKQRAFVDIGNHRAVLGTENGKLAIIKLTFH